MTDIWLKFQGVGIGPYRRDLVDKYWKWEVHPRTMLGFGQTIPQSLETRTAGIDRQLENSSHPRFTIYDVATPSNSHATPVGLASLTMDETVQTAEFIINLDPSYQGKGIGTKATKLVLDYAFHISHLRMVWLKCLEQNAAGVLAYAHAGFKAVGRLRQSGYWLGVPCDEIIMDALPEDLEGWSVVTATVETEKWQAARTKHKSA